MNNMNKKIGIGIVLMLVTIGCLSGCVDNGNGVIEGYVDSFSESFMYSEDSNNHIYDVVINGNEYLLLFINEHDKPLIKNKYVILEGNYIDTDSYIYPNATSFVVKSYEVGGYRTYSEKFDNNYNLYFKNKDIYDRYDNLIPYSTKMFNEICDEQTSIHVIFNSSNITLEFGNSDNFYVDDNCYRGFGFSSNETYIRIGNRTFQIEEGSLTLNFFKGEITGFEYNIPENKGDTFVVNGKPEGYRFGGYSVYWILFLKTGNATDRYYIFYDDFVESNYNDYIHEEELALEYYISDGMRIVENISVLHH